MTVIAKINDEEITAFDFVKYLKFVEKFDDIFEGLMMDRLTARAAKKRGIEVPPEAIQKRVDDIRRVKGLHRAQDTHSYIESLNMSGEEFEQHMREIIYKEKVYEEICDQKAVEEYFRLNSPKFETVELSHIVLNSENIVSEVMAQLEDDPNCFFELAQQHSLDSETRHKGGALGKIRRGKLKPEIEAMVFNAEVGQVIEPFESDDGLLFEIFKVTNKESAELSQWTVEQIKKILYEEWLDSVAEEFNLEAL